MKIFNLYNICKKNWINKFKQNQIYKINIKQMQRYFNSKLIILMIEINFK